jgi:hypothetical protein
LRIACQGAALRIQQPRRRGCWVCSSARGRPLRINDNEFLFDVAVDARERANLRLRQPEAFERLRAQWQRWNDAMLPITPEVFSHGVTPDVQADRYAPERAVRDVP